MTEIQAPPARTTDEPMDRELAARARDGDTDAFGTLYTRHSAHIYNFLRDLVDRTADAEDLMQETFLHALQGIAKLRDTDTVRSWLFSIAYNCARMQGRKRRTASLDELVERTGFDIESEVPGPEQAAVSRDRIALVWTAAQSLDRERFAVLDLSLRYGFSPTEIAAVMGKSPGNGRVLLHRAREQFEAAVRATTVAQVQGVCPTLRELVPVGQAGPLTPSQRRSVERHLGCCDECRSLADRMTAPAELLSGVLLLPLPAAMAGRDWLHAARQARPTGRRWWQRSTSMATQASRLPFAALGVAGVVVVAGVAGGVAAVTHRTSPAAPAAAQRHAQASPTVVPTSTAVAVPSTAVRATPAVADESGKSADAVWADMLTATRAAQSYHIAFTTTSLSDDVTQFDVRFAASGNYAGTVTLALASHDPFSVVKVNGTMYAQGAIIQHQPDLFGLTAAQAAQVGTGWLQLTGAQARQDDATLIDRTLSMWGDPRQLANTVFTVEGTLRLAGTDTLNGEELIVLGDDTGTVSVTRFGALPRRASNGMDSATFSDFNVPVTVAAPAGALVFS